MGRGLWLVLLGITCLCGLSGCIAVGPDNPNFAVSDDTLWDEVRRVKAEPVPLQRPVVVIGGYRAPDIFNSARVRQIKGMTSGEMGDFLRVPTWFDDQIQPVVDRTVALVAERFGTSSDETETVEVDVVGFSMGGLVARLAAIESGDGSPRLKINRLFTVATPHRGAVIADRVAFDDAARSMRAGSDLFASMDAAWPDRDYEVIPYAMLRDQIVGEHNAAPPGMTPLWLRGKLFGTHLAVPEDDRILLDIALRLRGEQPIAKPGTPLPQ